MGSLLASSYLSSNLRIRLKIQQPLRKLSAGSVIVRFREKANSAPQSNLRMWRLELAVREVGGKLQASPDVIRFSFNHTAPLELDRDTQEVFASRGHGVTPLRVC